MSASAVLAAAACCAVGMVAIKRHLKWWSLAATREAQQRAREYFWGRISHLKRMARPKTRNWEVRGLAKENSHLWSALRMTLRRQPASARRAPEADIDKISETEFCRRFEHSFGGDGEPCLLKGKSIRGWPCMKSQGGWGLDELCERFASSEFRLSDAHGATVSLKDFQRYCRENMDDSPIAVYDSAFAERDPESGLAAEYKTPVLFSDDIFNYYWDRPPYRWILLAPERSGTGVHLDPLCTSAWLALCRGYKRWVFFPPRTDPRLIGGPCAHSPAVESIVFFNEILPKLIEKGWGSRNNDYDRGRAFEEGNKFMVEILQGPGDIVYVPPGWWHVVLNLDDTASITHNYLSRYAIIDHELWPELCAHQPDFAPKLFQQLAKFEPEIATRLWKQHVKLREEGEDKRDAKGISKSFWNVVDSSMPREYHPQQTREADLKASDLLAENDDEEDDLL